LLVALPRANGKRGKTQTAEGTVYRARNRRATGIQVDKTKMTAEFQIPPTHSSSCVYTFYTCVYYCFPITGHVTVCYNSQKTRHFRQSIAKLLRLTPQCLNICLVINSLRGGDTHTQISQTEVISRNQVRAGLWSVHAWFKNWWHNNHDLKYFAQNQLSNLALFICFLTSHNISIISKARQQHINYCSKKNPYYCYSLYLNYSSKSFLHIAIIHKPVFVPHSYNGQQYACICTLVVTTWWW